MPLDDKTKQHMESGLEHAVRVVQTRFTQSAVFLTSRTTMLFPGTFDDLTPHIDLSKESSCHV